MSKIFSIDELATFAVKIEEEGMAFYKEMAEKTKNKDAKELYEFLVGEEAKHKVIFQELKDVLSKDVSPGTYGDEYNSYMRALVESVVFKKDDKRKAGLQDEADVLDYAIDKEKDSILFYLGMKEMVSPENQVNVEKIINEERLHIIKLLDIKEQIG